MTCHPAVATNRRLAEVAAELRELIAWAEADAEHAANHDAPGVAKDDRRRARRLRRALTFVQHCRR